MIAEGLVLAAFLSSAGLALDQAFRDTALTTVTERLTSRVYSVLGMVDLGAPASIATLSSPADPALSDPESGHYAQLLDASNKRVWNSRSMLGITFTGPNERSVGDFTFSTAISSAGESLFVLSYTVLWEGQGTESTIYTIQVAENKFGFTAQVNRFRKSLYSR